MSKLTLTEAIAAEIANGNGNVAKVESNKFNAQVRNMDAGDPLEKGDIISIPENYEVLSIVIDANRKDDEGKPIATPYIMAEVTNPEKGTEKNVRFFPNQLCKVCFPVDEDGKRLPKVKTSGSASKHFASFNDVDEAMADLKGKKIVVTDDNVYRTERYGDRQVVNTHIYQYDFEA